MKGSEEFYSSYIANCVFNSFLSYTAIMLNIVTIHAIRKTSSMPKPLRALLQSLAVSDLGVGLLVQPMYIAFLVMKLNPNTENNSTFITILTALLTLFTYASFFGVTALSADRFLAVHLHLRYKERVTYKRVVAAVISIWAFSAFLSSLDLWIPNLTLVFAVFDGACLVTTTVLYSKIYVVVRRHRNQIQALQVQIAHVQLANAARQRKSAVATLYIYLVFLACCLPNICIYVAAMISGRSILIKGLSRYTITLVFLNSSLNPLIYCWKMRHIRHAIMGILRNIIRRN